jgi:ATP-dependent protease ClpP protease subunit
MFRALGRAAVLGGLLYSSAHAADITSHIDAAKRVAMIAITGEIEDGDSKKFEDIVADITRQKTLGRVEKVGVILDSPGGALADGLDIGMMIRQNGFLTGVPDDARCASVCGLIWLAGVQRFVGERGNVGFHAAYDAASKISATGNALIGSYLTKLNLPLDAIVYATKAPPKEMQWLTPADAKKNGIDLTVIPSTPKAASNSHPFQQQQQSQPPAAALLPGELPDDLPTSAPTQVTSLEQQAINVVRQYHIVWSESGRNVEPLAYYYANSVDYFGKATPRAKVMDEKRKFSLRWPVRHYQLRNLSADCTHPPVCTVSGIVAWETQSEERNERSVGTANMLVQVALTVPGGGLIVAENGSTISREKSALHSGPARSSVSTSEQATIDEVAGEFFQTYKKSGMLGLVGAVKDCYAKAIDLRRCMLLDVASYRLDLAGRRQFGQGVEFFEVAAFSARFERYWPQAGFTNPDQAAGYLSQGADSIPQWVSEHPTFTEGWKARLEYQAWFDALPATPFRDGAEYWAANRSNKVPPSCDAPDFLWKSGCEEAKRRLDPSDLRRHADKDFKLGWNSL